MKFLCVFVLYFCVRTSYSYYTPSTVSKPIDSTNKYGVSNSQNRSTQENISGQESSSQLDYRMGPGLPIPYQTAQTSPGIPSNVQTNTQGYNQRYYPHASAIHHVIANPHLKAIYKKSIPKKRYTVLHPNGTIEHTDEIHAVKSQYSNYLMVKAADILAHINHPHVNNNIGTPSQNTSPSRLSQPIKTTDQKVEWASTNTYDKSRSNQFVSNGDETTTVSKANSISEQYSNTNNQELGIGSTNAQSNSNIGSSNAAVISEPIGQQNQQSMNNVVTNVTFTEGILKDAVNNSSLPQDNNVAAANPLPIYSASHLPVAELKHQEQPGSPAASDGTSLHSTVTKDVSDTNAVSESNSVNSGNYVENQIVSNNQTSSIKSANNEPAEKVLEVILPEVQHHSTSQIQTAPTSENANQDEVTSGVTTIEESIVPENTKSAPVITPNTIIDVGASKNTQNVKIPTDVSKESTDTININEIVQKLNDNNHSTTSSVSNRLLTPLDSSAPTVFRFSDDSLWEAIRNNASNVYFFFLPPKPKLYREIRTTIFPNGTTVEQIIETDDKRDLDGKPKVIKN